ncbi:MAG TPA: hypothetical protein VMB21_14345 [Candidatus Limnocylindria bacterium]|nr:hypothetical protein [Candidatus Limnocylindria bacterium]
MSGVALGLAWLATGTAALGQTATPIDLTSGGSAQIGGAYFFPGQSSAVAGSGTFGSVVRIQANGSEQGYNSGSSPVMPDVKNGVNFRFGDFRVPANPGGMVNGVAYYSFSLDINEGNAPGNNLLSLDKLQFFVRTSDFSGSGADTANSYANLANSATKVYDMDATSDNTLLLNNTLVGGGSSSVDLVMLVPQSLFAAYGGSATNVFLYYQMGALGTYSSQTWTSDGGFEEWAAVSGLTFTIPAVVPEPGTVGAVGGVAVIFAGHCLAQYRRRRSMAGSVTAE